MEKGMKLVGIHWWADKASIEERKLKDVIINNDEKEIAVDYEYGGRQIQMKLQSKDGVNFEGEYGTARQKIGSCAFTLYKNKEGYLLCGGYSSPTDETGNWWIELKPVPK